MGFRLLLLALASSVVLAAINVPFGKGNRKEEIMLPMRDGVELHTLIYLPGARKEANKFPAVIDRSPYGYGDMEWITDIFLPFGFVAVGQDMRGTEMSQGNFTMWMSDTEDSRDLGDWIVSQEWSNGQIYTFGASADGLGSLQTPQSQPSWLAGQYVAWAPENMYDILFPYGTYKQKTAEDWLYGVTMPNPDVVYDNIKTIHENEKGGSFWEKIVLSPETYKNIKFPTAFWAGWYDLFESGNLNAFDGYNNMCDESVKHTSKIVIDPLGHCLEGAAYFTQNAVEGRTGVMIAELFEVYGIFDVRRSAIKNITFYVMSSNDEAGLSAGQYWTSLETWPTARMTDYYLHADKTASTSAPSIKEDASTTFVYDPSNPVPTVGGNNLPPSIGGSIACGPLDQAEVDTRSDVLTFQTEVQQRDLALTGGIMATLYVSSDVIDTDVTVKISDVYPTGEARLLQDNAVRMRWRNGSPTPEYLKKGEVYEVQMNLGNTSYIVATGHALRISVSSSNFPRFSVNPNNGLLLADEKYPGENIVARNTIYHSAKYPSRVSLPVVQKIQLPQVHVLKEVQTTYPEITQELLTKFSASIEKMIKRPANKQKK